MFHLDNGSGIDVMPPQKQTISRQQKWFTEGDTQTPPSYPGADWFNIVQAELLNVLKDGGITPSKSELNQLSAAIKSIINKNQIKINDASLITKGVVTLSSSTNSTSETAAATSLAVKTVNDKINNFNDKFAWSDQYQQSVVMSPDKKFHLVVRNDGVVGVYSSDTKRMMWSFFCENFNNGAISASKIDNLDLFVKERVLPIGIPQPWPSDHLPAGWLECNGSPFDVYHFPKLATVYPWGTLPDLRGLFIRGKDNGRLLDPDREILSYQDDAIRNITGSFVAASSLSATATGAFTEINPVSGLLSLTHTQKDRSVYSFDASRVVPVSNENRPRNIAFIYIVKAE